jgi:DNA-directed RNA polymerase specialized sigma24 family protein
MKTNPASKSFTSTTEGRPARPTSKETAHHSVHHQHQAPGQSQPFVTDEEWLEQCTKHIGDLASSFRRTYFLSKEDQEDLGQDLAIKAIGLDQKYRAPAYKHFVRTALNNFAIDWWRKTRLYKHRNAPMSPRHEATHVTPGHCQEVLADIEAARLLSALSPTEQKVMALFAGLEDRPVTDPFKLAKLIGIPVEQVRSELETALTKMRATVEAGVGEKEDVEKSE